MADRKNGRGKKCPVEKMAIGKRPQEKIEK